MQTMEIKRDVIATLDGRVSDSGRIVKSAKRWAGRRVLILVLPDDTEA